MKFKPMQDRVLVRPMQPESAGGVLIPETSGEGPRWGVVLAVGDGSRFQNGQMIPVRVAVGQRVMFERHCGVKVLVQTEQLVMLREAEIMGTFEEDDAVAGPVQLHSV